MKTCANCKTAYPLEYFSKNRQNADGLACYCRACNARKQREWKYANHAKVLEWKKRYRERMKEARSEQ